MYGGNPFYSRRKKRGKSNSHPSFADGGASDRTLDLLREASRKLERLQRKQPSPPRRRYLEPWRETPSPRARGGARGGGGGGGGCGGGGRDTVSSTSDPEPEPFRIPGGAHHTVDILVGGAAGHADDDDDDDDDDVDMTPGSRGDSFSSDASGRSSSFDASFRSPSQSMSTATTSGDSPHRVGSSPYSHTSPHRAAGSVGSPLNPHHKQQKPPHHHYRRAQLPAADHNHPHQQHLHPFPPPQRAASSSSPSPGPSTITSTTTPAAVASAAVSRDTLACLVCDPAGHRLVVRARANPASRTGADRWEVIDLFTVAAGTVDLEIDVAFVVASAGHVQHGPESLEAAVAQYEYMAAALQHHPASRAASSSSLSPSSSPFASRSSSRSSSRLVAAYPAGAQAPPPPSAASVASAAVFVLLVETSPGQLRMHGSDGATMQLARRVAARDVLYISIPFGDALAATVASSGALESHGIFETVACTLTEFHSPKPSTRKLRRPRGGVVGSGGSGGRREERVLSEYENKRRARIPVPRLPGVGGLVGFMSGRH